jgi:hypothetical protein
VGGPAFGFVGKEDGEAIGMSELGRHRDMGGITRVVPRGGIVVSNYGLMSWDLRME